MSEREFLEYGNKLIAQMHEEYQKNITDYEWEDEGNAMLDVMEGVNNYEWSAILWASGAIGAALDSNAVIEAVEDAIIKG